MNRFCLSALSALVTFGAFALPSLTDVAANKRSDGSLRVKYFLRNEPAVITLSLFDKQSGEKIDESLFTNLSGAVNRLVQPNASKKSEFSFVNNTGVSDANLDVRVRAWPTNCPPDYVVISLTNTSETVRYYVNTNAFPEPISSAKYKKSHFVMRKIPAANVEFEMGATALEWGSNSTAPHHYAILSDDYYIGIYEMTYRQFCNSQGLSSYAPSGGGYWGTNEFVDVRQDDWPVGCVSYGAVRGLMHETKCSTTMEGFVRYYNWPRDGHTLNSAVKKCACTSYPGNYEPNLNVMRRRFGFEFDLPTEAQWEFACRANTFGRSYTQGFYCAEDKTTYGGRANECPYDFNEYAWHFGNSTNQCKTIRRPTVHSVGLKKPNAFGLYDMLGNAWELCLDYYQGNTYPKSGEAVTDPEGADTGDGLVLRTHYRTVRGGSVNSDIMWCRPGYRSNVGPADVLNCPGAASGETSLKEAGWNFNVGFRVAAPACAAR